MSVEIVLLVIFIVGFAIACFVEGWDVMLGRLFGFVLLFIIVGGFMTLMSYITGIDILDD